MMNPRLLLVALLGPITALVLGTAGPAGAQTAPVPPAVPSPSAPDACVPGPPTPACDPATTPAPRPVEPGEPAPPVSPADPAPPPRPLPPMGDPVPPGCGFSNIPACISAAMAEFFKSIVGPGWTDAIKSLKDTGLSTPQLDEVPVMGQVWGNSQQIVLVSYCLVVTVAGLVVLTYQTLHTRASIKEVLPRVLVGFLAANLSMLVAGWAIDLANGFCQAILGDLDPDQIGQSMADTVKHDIDGGTILVLFVALALRIMILVVMVTYVVRIMLTTVLLAAAPMLLITHALPQTEGIAFWWWKAFAGTLVIQIGQAFTLVTAAKLFFLPGGITLS